MNRYYVKQPFSQVSTKWCRSQLHLGCPAKARPLRRAVQRLFEDGDMNTACREKKSKAWIEVGDAPFWDDWEIYRTSLSYLWSIWKLIHMKPFILLVHGRKKNTLLTWPIFEIAGPLGWIYGGRWLETGWSCDRRCGGQLRGVEAEKMGKDWRQWSKNPGGLIYSLG